jgi:DHA3 family macrolide efflux protein-like MFS transporter
MQIPESGKTRRPSGMLGFSIVWAGQMLSVLASNMTGFGFSLWMYKQTHSATAMAGVQIAYVLGVLLVTPIAGVLVDRHNRKLMMMLSDLGAVTVTAAILVLYASGHLQFWHLYVSAAINGIGNTFQWLAFSAAISSMLPKEQYARADGMMSLVSSGPGVAAPILAGVILAIPFAGRFDGMVWIMFMDVATFFIAIGTIGFVHVPQPEKTVEGQKQRGNMLKEAVYGFTYIFQRPSLMGMQLVFLIGNLFSMIGFTLMSPMVLARSGQNSLAFGSFQTAGAIGGLAGALIMSAWGGFKKRIHGVLAGWTLIGIFLACLGLVGGLPVWITFMLLTCLCIPVIDGSNQAIWQAKVAPDIQGRVFSVRLLTSWLTNPVTPAIAGVLADFVFEPAMRTQGGLAEVFSPLVGSGPGAGMGLLMVFTGICTALVGLSGYLIRPIREAESLLADHDQTQIVGTETVG